MRLTELGHFGNTFRVGGQIAVAGGIIANPNSYMAAVLNRPFEAGHGVVAVDAVGQEQPLAIEIIRKHVDVRLQESRVRWESERPPLTHEELQKHRTNVVTHAPGIDRCAYAARFKHVMGDPKIKLPTNIELIEQRGVRLQENVIAPDERLGVEVGS